MRSILVSWVGIRDLRAAAANDRERAGPIAATVLAREFTEIHLLSDHAQEDGDAYGDWLEGLSEASVVVHRVELSGPTAFGEIHSHARATVDGLGASANDRLSFQISAGTNAMAAVWIILGKTRYPAELIESSIEAGVKTVSVPFDLAADFVPDLLEARSRRVRDLTASTAPPSAAFEQIIHRSAVMRRTVERARRVAAFEVNVLIEGESGTGKELFARAIHDASPRSEGPFIPVNCGALPENLLESLLFGHKKGAFTGATKDNAGHFREARGGTLFLDEIGELPLPAQVKLLRALQEKKVTPLGASKPESVDVRVVAATNRNLLEEARAARFRSDLFYRLGVGILRLPPLRDREGDIGLLVDHFFEAMSKEKGLLRGDHKNLSASARNLLLNHSWPGNVRELENTLKRAAIWAAASVSSDDVQEALLPTSEHDGGRVLDRALGDGLDIRALVTEVESHYVTRAWAESGRNKTKAAKLLGLPSYQTFTNWMARLGID